MAGPREWVDSEKKGQAQNSRSLGKRFETKLWFRSRGLGQTSQGWFNF